MDIGGSLCKLVYYEPFHVAEEDETTKIKLDEFIAGSLASFNASNNTSAESPLTLYNSKIQGTIHFLKFQTSQMHDFIQIVKNHGEVGSKIMNRNHRNSLNSPLLASKSPLLHSINSNSNHHSTLNNSSWLSNLSSSSVSPRVCATGGGAFKFQSLFSSSLNVELHISDELEALVRGIDFILHTVQNECYYLSQFLFKQPIQTENYGEKRISLHTPKISTFLAL
jgi:type II pantothenate kinase